MLLKNTPSIGSRMLKMGDETYQLRRNVMDVIYQAKRIVDLPRVEVRIVETRPCTMGYAYLGKNIIHISNRYAMTAGPVLDALVLHEIVHTVKAQRHVETCPLMQANYTAHPESVVWDAFKKYF